MNKKLIYEVPETELLEVKIEKHFLESQQNNSNFETATVNKSYIDPDVWSWE